MCNQNHAEQNRVLWGVTVAKLGLRKDAIWHFNFVVAVKFKEQHELWNFSELAEWSAHSDIPGTEKYFAIQ